MWGRRGLDLITMQLPTTTPDAFILPIDSKHVLPTQRWPQKRGSLCVLCTLFFFAELTLFFKHSLSIYCRFPSTSLPLLYTYCNGVACSLGSLAHPCAVCWLDDTNSKLGPSDSPGSRKPCHIAIHHVWLFLNMIFQVYEKRTNKEKLVALYSYNRL